MGKWVFLGGSGRAITQTVASSGGSGHIDDFFPVGIFTKPFQDTKRVFHAISILIFRVILQLLNRQSFIPKFRFKKCLDYTVLSRASKFFRFPQTITFSSESPRITDGIAWSDVSSSSD